ncbi:MAG: Major outer membrane porin [Chlamydiales bacterium]|nr:Major outer membrane porin [Chlamydiales bacterium]MCH9619849.1 Major outer membrane porin [Chlamydiales bacterium]MCH9622724.1 Major outer membrane porin [Chlamydiales bacterium]
MRWLLPLFFLPSLIALPLGNPSDPSHYKEGVSPLSIRMGFYGSYTYDLDLQVNQSDDPSVIHQSEMLTNAGLITLNFRNRLDLFATLGVSKLTLNLNSKVLKNSSNLVCILQSASAFSYSVGLRGTIWEWGSFNLGAEGEYAYTCPRLNRLVQEGSSPFYFNQNDRMKYQEWQVGVGASYDIISQLSDLHFIPYAGLSWGNTWVNMGNKTFFNTSVGSNYTLPNLVSDRTWGYAVGFSLIGAKKWSCSAEGSFASEIALNINTQFRF